MESNMKKLEYIWLDGYKPEPNLRSKVKVTDSSPPDWSFDGSSTLQAANKSRQPAKYRWEPSVHSPINLSLWRFRNFHVALVSRDRKPLRRGNS